MKLNKPLVHMRLDQCQFFWWDPRIDPREPEYWKDSPSGGLFYVCIS